MKWKTSEEHEPFRVRVNRSEIEALKRLKNMGSSILTRLVVELKVRHRAMMIKMVGAASFVVLTHG